MSNGDGVQLADGGVRMNSSRSPYIAAILSALFVACQGNLQTPVPPHGMVRAFIARLSASGPASPEVLADGNPETGAQVSQLGRVHVAWSPSMESPLLAVRVGAPAGLRTFPPFAQGEHPLRRGWNLLPLGDATTGGLSLEVVGAAEVEVQELELWGAGDAAAWAEDRALVTAAEDPATIRLLTVPDHARFEMMQGQCADFRFDLPFAPLSLQRVVLAAEVTHLWGLFSLERRINGGAPQGAVALDALADGGRRPVQASLPLSQLRKGENTVTFCADPWLPTAVTIERIRVVAEVDRGGIAAPLPKSAWRAVTDGDPRSGGTLPLSVPLLHAVRAIGIELVHSRDLQGLRLFDGAREVNAARTVRTPAGSVLALEEQELAGPLTLDGRGDIQEFHLWALTESKSRASTLVVDFPRFEETVGPYGVVTGHVTGPTQDGVATLTGDHASAVSAPVLAGSFALAAVLSGGQAASQSATLRVELSDGTSLETEIAFSHDIATVAPDGRPTSTLDRDEERARWGLVGDVARGSVTPENGGEIVLGTRVRVHVPAQAVSQPTEVSLRRVSEMGVRRLNPGMVNVTAPGGAVYRFEPSPMHFLNKVAVTLPWDPSLVPPGVDTQGIQTFYFDDATMRYEPLEMVTVDDERQTALALTDHFTDMINAILVKPESPTPQAFNPNSVGSTPPANPTTGMTLVAPPEARQDGAAVVTYPFALPKGRGRYQPGLALVYNSQATRGGIAGSGWGLPISSIEVDTKFGTPEYSEESTRPGERYLWDGQPLVPAGNTVPCMEGGGSGQQFRLRREGRFAQVVRCGGNKEVYHWEVTEKDGTLFVYGSRDVTGGDGTVRGASLDACAGAGDQAPIGRWMLSHVVDTNGNRASYEYEKECVGQADSLVKFRTQRLSAVRWGANPPMSHTFQVTLSYDRSDPLTGMAPGSTDEEPVFHEETIDASMGFPVLQPDRLKRVAVECLACSQNERLVRDYALVYAPASPETLYKTQLLEVLAGDARGVEATPYVHHTAFEYENLEKRDAGAGLTPLFLLNDTPVFGGADGSQTWRMASGDLLPLRGSVTKTVGASAGGTATAGIGFHHEARTPGMGIGVSVDINDTRPTVSMLDINGDGLPDRLVSRIPLESWALRAGHWLVSHLLPDIPSQRQVYFNNGTEFVRGPGTPGGSPLDSDPDLVGVDVDQLPSLGHEVGFRGMVNAEGGGGISFISATGMFNVGGGLQLTLGSLMDLDGDGLVDEVAPQPHYQRRNAGIMQFQTAEEQPIGCLDLDQGASSADGAGRSGVLDTVRTVSGASAGRDVVWRWRAPFSGTVSVTVAAEPLVSCAGDSQPPTTTVLVVTGPQSSGANGLPIPAAFPSPDPKGTWGSSNEFEWSPEVGADEFLTRRANRYRELSGEAPTALASEPAVEFAPPIVIPSQRMERGGELLFRFRAGASCADDQLGGLTDALNVHIQIAYAESDCADRRCLTPFSNYQDYDSNRDFRVPGQGPPTLIQRDSADAELTGSLHVVGFLADEVVVRVVRSSCSPERLASGLNLNPTKDFPFDGWDGSPIDASVLERGIDDVGLPRDLLRAAAWCDTRTVRPVIAPPPRGWEADNVAVLSPESIGTVYSVRVDFTDLQAGEMLFVEVEGRTPIDPDAIVAAPFFLRYHDQLAASAAPPLLREIAPPMDGRPGAIVRVPVSVGSRKLEPRGGAYTSFVPSASEVTVRAVLPPTWMMGSADDRPTLLVQQERRSVRVPLEPRTEPVCPKALCALWCVPGGCGDVCGKRECYGVTAPRVPYPVATASVPVEAGVVTFVSLEPPARVLEHTLLPPEADLARRVKWLVRWMDPGNDALFLAQWLEWMMFIEAIETRAISGVLPEPLLVIDSGEGPREGINILEPAGTLGLPLPLPMSGFAGALTADAFRGWGFGEYQADPTEPAANSGVSGATPDPASYPPRWQISMSSFRNNPQEAFIDAVHGQSIPFWPPVPAGGASTQSLHQIMADVIASPADVIENGGAALFNDAAAAAASLPYQLGAQRIHPMFPDGAGFRGSCSGTTVTASVTQPGRCDAGGVSGFQAGDGEDTGLADALATARRFLTCPRPVPNATVSASVSVGARAYVVGARGDVGMSAGLVSYRDLTGDGLPDLVVDGPGALRVVPTETRGPGIVARPPLRTWGVPAQLSASVGAALNAAASKAMLPMATHGQGRGSVPAANAQVADSREGPPIVSSAASIGAQMDLSQFMDINGDGRTDMIRTGVACPGLVVRLNQGGYFGNQFCMATDGVPFTLGNGISLSGSMSANVGFGTQRTANCGLSIPGALSRRDQFAMMADVNGDGLLDRVSRSYGATIRVSLNLGSRFSPPVPLTSAVATPQTAPEAVLLDWDLPGSTRLPANERVTELLRALGGGFADARRVGQSYLQDANWLDILPHPLSTNSSFTIAAQSGGGAGGTFLVYGVPVTLTYGLSDSKSGTINWVNTDFFDMNGDGLPEPVRLGMGQELEANINRLGSVGRLRTITNALGGKIRLTYQRSKNTFDMPQVRWLLSGVAVDHGVETMEGNSGLTNRVHARSIEYRGGKWDRQNREFLGFGEVITREGRDWNTREGEHNVEQRTSCKTYHVDNYDLAGKIQEERSSAITCSRQDSACTARMPLDRCQDDDTRVQAAVHEYHPIAVLGVVDAWSLCPRPRPLFASGAQDACRSTVALPSRTVREEFENGRISSRKEQRFVEYDAYGNLIEALDADDVVDTGDDVTVRVTYRPPMGNYVVGLPDGLEVSANGVVLRKRTADYDDRGNLSHLREWHETGFLETSFHYDSVGNIDEVVAPTGYTVGISYETTASLLPAGITDSLGLTTTLAEHDLRWGVAKSETDANGATIRKEVDDRGRVVRVFSPSSSGDNPAVELTYDAVVGAGGDPRRWAETTERSETGSVVHSFAYLDGMGDVVYKVRTEETDYSNATVSGMRRVDGLGNVVALGRPFGIALTRNQGHLFGTPSANMDLVAPTFFAYDARGRVREVSEPTTAQRRLTKTSYSADVGARALLAGEEPEDVPRTRVSVTAQSTLERSIRTDRLMDGTELQEVIEFDATAPRPAAKTVYRYNLMRELREVHAESRLFANIEHDMLGRVKSETTLDTGTKSYDYDPVTGLLNSETNAAGQTVSYSYEPRSSRLTRLNRGDRFVWLDYGGVADKATHGVGRLKQALYDVPAGGLEEKYAQAAVRCMTDTLCSAEHYAYDALGNQTLRERRVGVDDWIRLTQTFDSFGRVRSIREETSARADVKIDYAYNTAGRVRSATGTSRGQVRDWVPGARYDHQGRAVEIELGNGVKREFIYDLETDWATDLRTCVGGVGSPCLGSQTTYQTLHLGHDLAGNITSAISTASHPRVVSPAGGSYYYDGRDRLRQAVQSVRLGGGFAGRVEAWEFDEYNRLKTHTAELTSDTGVNLGAARNDTFEYEGFSRRVCSNPSCTENRFYDDAGRVVEIGAIPGQGRQLTWTADNMLRQVTERNPFSGGRTEIQRNGYALAGERTVRHGQHGTFRYMGAPLTVSALGLNAHVFFGASRVATEFEGGTFYYVGDHIGSTALVLGDQGEVVSQVVLGPYGDELWEKGTAEWEPPAQRFLLTAKEKDPETSYSDFGWRMYSADGMSWLSPEPFLADAIEQGPIGLNLYHYSKWNPVRFTDPDGRAPPGSGGGAGSEDEAFPYRVPGLGEADAPDDNHTPPPLDVNDPNDHTGGCGSGGGLACEHLDRELTSLESFALAAFPLQPGGGIVLGLARLGLAGIQTARLAYLLRTGGAVRLGGTVLSGEDVALARLAANAPAESGGYWNVVVHANSQTASVWVQGRWVDVSHRTLAHAIETSPGYVGQPVRLIACNAGACGTGVAQNLANKLGVPVQAADAPVILLNGYAWTPGNILLFTPRGR